jgi:hypothetical protein
LASVVGHSATVAPLFATPSTSAPVRWVACTSVQRASTANFSSSHSTGRAPRNATQSCTSPICSAMWMWMRASLGNAARTSRIAASGTARRLWKAQPTRSVPPCRARSDSNNRR